MKKIEKIDLNKVTHLGLADIVLLMCQRLNEIIDRLNKEEK